MKKKELCLINNVASASDLLEIFSNKSSPVTYMINTFSKNKIIFLFKWKFINEFFVEFPLSLIFKQLIDFGEFEYPFQI